MNPEESTMPATPTPDQRAAYVCAIAPQPDDRDSIARARHAVATEVRHTRNAIRHLADTASTDEGCMVLEDATHRLRLLMRRVAELSAMAKATADA